MMMLSSRDRDPAAAFLDVGASSGATSAGMASFINTGASALGMGSIGSISGSGALSGSVSTLSASASSVGSTSSASGEAGSSEAVARMNSEFSQFLRDRELMQNGLIRSLEDNVRHMAQYKDRMMGEVREFVGQRMQELACSMEQTQRRPAIDALVDDLFNRRETLRGLLGWLPASLQPRAAELVRVIQLDILEGNGNGVRTSFNDLLLLYMRALGVQDVLNVVILGEPLGTLITQYMKNYLSSIQQYDLKMMSSGSTSSSGGSFDYYASMSGGGGPSPPVGDADADDDASLLANFDTDVQRLTGALYCVKNVGNWASHNRGALGFFKQLELCGAMGAMAETLPHVWRMYNRYKDAKDAASIKRQEQEQAEAHAHATALAALSITSPPLPPSSSSSSLPPGLMSSASWPSPRHSFSSDSPASSSPQRGIWASSSPSPSSSSGFNSGSAPLPPGLPSFPLASDQRSMLMGLSSSTFVPPLPQSQPPPLPPSQPPSQPSAVLTARPPSPVVLPKRATTPKPNYQFFYAKDADIPQPDGRTKVMFRAMLEHMRLVDKARLCQQGPACSGRLSGQCSESHTYQEVMTYNPLYKLLKCTQPDHFSYVDVQEHSWCVCAHVDVGTNTEWMNNYTNTGERNLNSKGYLCEYRERCTNGRCYKAHSEVEVCWYNPFFRTKECEFGRSCHFGSNCLALHEGQQRRQPTDGYVGLRTKMLFLERTHKAVAEKLVLVDPRFTSY
jgi:hypothetical protein